MRRTLIGLAGLVYGFLLMWLCLYAFSHMDWHQPQRMFDGCPEIGLCSMPWWVFPTLLLYFWGPPLLFAGLNAVAWRRWKPSKWMWCFASLTTLSIILYLSSYPR